VNVSTSAATSIVFVGAHTANFTHAPGVGFTEREDLQSGSTSTSAGVAVEEISAMTQPPTVTGTFSGRPDWSAIAIELRD
jgi:hypothetical protein